MPRTKGSKNKKTKIKEYDVSTPNVVIVETSEVPEVKQPKIGRLTVDFGREDLNQLGNKVNEVLDLVDPI